MLSPYILSLGIVNGVRALILITSNTSWYLWKFRQGTIEALVAAGHEVVCLAPEDEYSHKLTAFGARFVAIPLEGKNIGPVRELKSLWAIFMLLRQLRPSFAFNFTIKMNLYVGLSCRLLGIAYSNNVSGLGTVFLHKGLAYKLAQKLYGLSNAGAQKVFFQNDEDLQTFVDLALVKPSRAQLLPGSGVNTQSFALTPLPNTATLSFLMISRLIADKGVREYVAAAQLLQARGIDCRCVLLGPSGVSNTSAIGDAELALWQEQKLVDYVGSQDDVRPFIAAAHVLVLPSYREGMPRTVLEAASMGRPAIVSDVPGCRQSIVAGETGWFCEMKCAESLAQVMQVVATTPKEVLQHFASASRRRVVAKFSEKLVINAYLDCLALK